MHGWINLDKPLGMSSAQAVDRVKKILQDPRLRGDKIKIGHAGTLDPLASGVLVLALGEATKLVNYAMDAPKEYIFTASWGEERSTDDAEGEVTATSDKRPTLAEIEAILPEFIGDILQAPPAYSAIKMDGKRAYAMARAGEAPEMKERVVRVDRLQVSGDRGQNPSDTRHPLPETTFLCGCGKGTYIRSLARDMGRRLVPSPLGGGSGWGHSLSDGANNAPLPASPLRVEEPVYGYVSMLRRVRVGKFSENDALTLAKLEELVHKGDLGFLRPPQDVLDDILAIELNAEETARLKSGQRLPKPPELQSETTVACMSGGVLVVMARTDGMFLKPERVFNI